MNTGKKRGRSALDARVSGRRRRGVVLVGVLAFVVLLMGVLMDFTYRTKVNLDIAQNRMDTARVRLATESAVDIMKAVLARSVDMHDPELEDLFFGGRHFLIDGIEMYVLLEPENAKINLNRLITRSGPGAAQRGFRREVQLLFRLADVLNEEYEEPILTYDMVLSILEWVNPPEVTDPLLGTLPGEPAGSAYYRELTPPYECKHAPLNTLSELLLVKGMTEEALYGRRATEESAALPGLSEFVTLYGSSRSIRSVLNREEVTMDDIREIEPMTEEEYLTIDIRASRGNVERRLRTVVSKSGVRVREHCREER